MAPKFPAMLPIQFTDAVHPEILPNYSLFNPTDEQS
jgi:hypothetical protein